VSAVQFVALSLYEPFGLDKASRSDAEIAWKSCLRPRHVTTAFVDFEQRAEPVMLGGQSLIRGRLRS